MKNQKGVISIFAIFAMLFLLVICLSIYFVIKSKLQIQQYEELKVQEIYSKSLDTTENIEYALENELIPIYNNYQLNVAGTGGFLKINNKIYECGRGMSYILKNNIIIDIDEDLKFKRVGANDYKLYATTYYIDKLSYDVYYYKDECYWKCLAYQKFNDESKAIVKNKTYLNNQFSIIGNYNVEGINSFMILWNDETGILNKYETNTQNINELVNINQIDVFRENIEKIDKSSGEFYVFVNVGESI